MPSPFPGMNPYLEHPFAWSTFHAKFLATAHTMLVAQVMPEYIVTIGERLYSRRVRHGKEPYIVAADDEPDPPAAPTDAPAYATLPQDVRFDRRRYLAVRSRGGWHTATEIELLGRAVKPGGRDHRAYSRHRLAAMVSFKNFVEIDLLRRGGRMPTDGMPVSDYSGLVYRVGDWPRVGVWPWNLRDAMPVIPIPLREGDPDAVLDLKAVLDRVYDEAGFEDYVYGYPPVPPLSADDAAWAAQFVPQPPARQEP